MAYAFALQARFRLNVDILGVMHKIGRWQHGILTRTGAYGRGVMRRQIRTARKGTKRTRIVDVQEAVTMRGRTFQKVTRCYVEPGKPVIDLDSHRPVSRATAEQARKVFSRRVKGQGEGSPPRNVTGKLKKNIVFDLEAKPGIGTVLIGARKFPSQPVMVNRVSVPELLNKGGGEYIHGELIHYGPRPFVETVFSITRKKMGEFIEQRPVHTV